MRGISGAALTVPERMQPVASPNTQHRRHSDTVNHSQWLQKDINKKRHPFQINERELLPAGTKQHPKGSTSLALGFVLLPVANQLLAPGICFLSLSSCAAGIVCLPHLFLPQDFLVICVQFQSTRLASGRNAHCILRQTKHWATQEFGLPRQLLKLQPRNRLPALCWNPDCTLSPVTPAPSALLGAAIPALTASSQANQKENILGSKKKRWKKACYHNAAPPSRLNVYRSSGNLSESLPSLGVPGTNSCQDDCLLTSSHTTKTSST